MFKIRVYTLENRQGHYAIVTKHDRFAWKSPPFPYGSGGLAYAAAQRFIRNHR